MKKIGRGFEFDLGETFPHLAAAPIVEAVIEWVARSTKPFQHSELQEQLANRLPDYPVRQPQHELELETRFDAVSSTQIRRDTWQGFRLNSADKRYVVQFTRDGIVFSRLKPYDNWDTFEAEARRVWRIFVELAEPSEVHRLGVRFINRIVLVEPAAIRQYLTNLPKSFEPVGLPMKDFLYQSVHDVPGYPFQVKVIQAIQTLTPPETKEYGLILDIDVITTKPFQLEDKVLDEHLAKMHWLKNKAFFSLLSKSALKSLEKGNA